MQHTMLSRRPCTPHLPAGHSRAGARPAALVSAPLLPCNRLICQAKRRKDGWDVENVGSNVREGIDSAAKNVQLQFELETNRLDTDLRDRVEDAVETLGFRVTAGDVAAESGVKVSEADRALQALAADTQGSLQVSSEGTVVYEIAPDFRSRLQQASLRRKAEPFLAGAQKWGYWALRVSFGIAFVTAVVVVWFAIIAAATSGDRDDRRSSGSSASSSFGGGDRDYSGGPMYFGNPFASFYYFDPYYYDTYRAPSSGMGFLESVFSLVFGDGDPNVDFDERRWAEVGRAIAANKGVMTAEQLGGFLDVDEDLADSVAAQQDSAYVEESWVLPALLRFGGTPVADGAGNLVYVFPSFAQSAGGMQKGGVARYAQEEEVPFSAASVGQRIGVAVLGGFLAVGVGILTNMVGTTPQVFMTPDLAWVFRALPFLQGFTASIFAVPVIRAIFNARRNAKIESRNFARMQMAGLATSSGPRAKAKRIAAEAAARDVYKVLDDKDIVFRSDREVGTQSDAATAAEFDRKLQALDSDRERRNGDWD